MTAVTVEQDVAAPADRVWELISDVTRMGEWSPENTGATWKGDLTGPVVGARFSGSNSNGKKRWSTDCTITESEPGREFGFRVRAAGLKIAHWSYRIESTATGCHVTETWTDERGGFAKFAGKFASGVADREAHNREGMVQTLAALAAAAERPA